MCIVLILCFNIVLIIFVSLKKWTIKNKEGLSCLFIYFFFLFKVSVQQHETFGLGNSFCLRFKYTSKHIICVCVKLLKWFVSKRLIYKLFLCEDGRLLSSLLCVMSWNLVQNVSLTAFSEKSSNFGEKKIDYIAS